MMIATGVARPLYAGLLALVVAAISPAQAQQPSPAMVALAKEIIIVKGGNSIYDPVIPQMIDRAKSIFMQSNPMLSKDLNEVAAKLRAELAPQTAALLDDGAKLYASKFTEAELKAILAFYKSPVGRKVTTQEPIILDESAAKMDAWGDKFAEDVIAKFRAEMRKRGHEI
jgi:hypothetical protein